MVIVTTFHIDRARDLVINNSNNIRDSILNKLQIISNELHNVGTRVDGSATFNKTNLQYIRNRLCGNNDQPDQAQTARNLHPLNDMLQPTTEILQRTFFSNATLALDATHALLGHVPPARYDIPPAILPLDELYGQLHALHQNSLEWLTHINHNVDSVLNAINPTNLHSQSMTLSKLRETVESLTNTVDSIHASLQPSNSNSDRPSSSTAMRHTRLEEIERSLETLHHKVDNITLSLSNANHKPSEPSKPSGPSALNAAKNLPVYQAAHPTRPCRTYGTILIDGAYSRIPMDITGRPASTALRVELCVTLTEQSTTVSYKIFDDGYLLTSDDIETAHKLQHYPGDCLALLHQKCPNFIYKIKAHSLC
uniref:40 kDa protein n=1 Tax=Garlic virus A TaxID=12433 RepID=U5IJK9_9VIRU|nr:40 kDa protein [Garlic virus A]AHB33490.1 40 kDa protein [Garlic virus A]